MDKKFHFTHPFLESLNETLSIMRENLDKLNSSQQAASSYGICNCCYKMRYITPEDVAEFVSNAHKGVKNGLINPNPYDIEMFAVESAKRFIENHGCVPFDDASCNGNSFASERHETLQDLLLIHANDVYNKEVCTPYEQKERFDTLKQGDLKIINDIHFPANMKNIVDKFPTLIEQMDGAEMYQAQPLVAKVFRALIEEFVIFASTLNMITTGNMVKFAIPEVTFNTMQSVTATTESGDMYQESVDSSKNAPVYFCFAQGKTPVISKAIQKATKSEFSHLSISFDSSLSTMYSFAKGGVRKEDIKGQYYKDIDVTIYGGYIAKDKVDKMKSICDDFIKNADKTKFDVGILLKKLVKKDGTLPKNEYRQVCTTFINHMMKEVDVELTDKNIPSPKEMKDSVDTRDTQFIQVYSGKAYDYKSSEANVMMKGFANASKSKAVNEYVTECCCLLKTNTMSIDSRLPFNFNLRNIVLQDTTGELDDTKNALEFVLNDSRSPIHELLVKYATTGRGSYDGEMVKNAFLIHGHDMYVPHESNRILSPEEALDQRTGYHTDPDWLDKIVYGDKYMDGNYRTDNPGNQHLHPIRYDISTIYRMFSCHHNDNEHLANNVVRVANVMMYLIRDYKHNHDVPWETLRDILAVFAEILTKSTLMLYHNNNRLLVYRDDMNDTMIPGYMYCEQFIMEADEETPKADPNANKKPTIENTTKGLKQGTKLQNATAKIKTLLQKFIEYIRNTISQIFPKFNEGHKREIEWIKKHEALNKEIEQAIRESKFSLKINDFPYFKVPADKITTLGDKANELVNKLKTPEGRKQYLEDADKLAKSSNTNATDVAAAVIYGLMYDAVKDKITPESLGKENKALQDAVRNYVLYSDPNGPAEKSRDANLTPELWRKEIIDTLTTDTLKLLSETTKSNQKALDTLTKYAKQMMDESEKKEKDALRTEGRSDEEVNKLREEANADGNFAQAFFNGIDRVTKDVYNATVSYIMKDVYGKTYNMYREIINEYQRQQSVGVENQQGTDQNATNNNPTADQGAASTGTEAVNG